MDSQGLNKTRKEASAHQEEAERKNKKILFLIAALVILVIALAITVGVLLWKSTTAAEANNENMNIENTPKRNVVVTEKNAEKIAEEMAEDEYVEPGYYTVNMATEWHFSTGDAISDNARVDNVERNTNPVYFDVFLAEDETNPIYSSPVIPVGSFLENIVLDQPLEKGDYDCVIVYHLVDDDQNTISTLRVTMKITVDA